MPRTEKHSQNWGGPDRKQGRKRQYVRIPIRFHIATTEPEQLTPQSDLSIYTAEMEEDGPRGIVVGEVWYGRDEALAIACFVQIHKAWLIGDEFYVYIHAYPESMGGAIFYVGKGIGDRIDQHEEEARHGHQCEKCDIIRSIWAAGEQVVKRKEYEHLFEEDAFTLESRLIKQLGLARLANKRTHSPNPMTSEERKQVTEYAKQILARYAVKGEENEE